MASILNRIESNFDSVKAVSFSREYWHWCFYIAAAYLLSIFAIQRWMKDRQRYELRKPLFVWSLSLCLFSLYGFSVSGVEQLRYLYSHGWERAMCDSVIQHKRWGLWSFLFFLSKGPELLDTYFVVLRKQKLIFLHWYHHVTVFIYGWYHWPYMVAPDQWFITWNYFIHSMMYLYYAVRATGRYRPPVWVNIFITLAQILQMSFGLYVNGYVYGKMTADPTWYCDGKVEKHMGYIYWSSGMCGSYLILFAHFFIKTYVCKDGKKDKEA